MFHSSNLTGNINKIYPVSSELSPLELETKVLHSKRRPEAHTWAFSQLKVHTSALTLLRN